MGFNPDEYLKSKEGAGGFDPDSYLASKEAKEPGSYRTSPVGAFARGTRDAALLDFADELGGAVEHPVGAAKAAFGGDGEDVEAYKKTRDEYRALSDASKKEHPASYLTGGLTGAVAGPGKFLAPLKGAKAVVAAGGLGAALGLGGSRAELSEGEHLKALGDTAVGGAVGAGTQYGLNKVAPKISDTASALSPRLRALLQRFRGAAPAAEGAAAGEVPVISENQVDTARSLADKIFHKGKTVSNPEEIMAAVETIGGKGTKTPGYMLTRDEVTQNLASTVLKDPTVAGELERRSIRPIQEGLNTFAEEAASKGSPISAYQTGESVRKGIDAEFAKRIAPAEAIYNDLESEFSRVPLNRVAFQRGIKAMREKAGPTDLQGRQGALLDQLERLFSKVEDVGQLKQMRTALGKNIDTAATPAEKEILGNAYDILTRERNRSILRYEKNIPSAGGILQKLKSADKLYRDELTKTAQALGVEGGRRETTRQAIGSFLKNTPAEDFQKKLFDRGDFGGLQRMKQAFPEQFEQLRQRALSDLIEKSSVNGVVSPQRLMTGLSKYGPEVQDLLLGDMLPKAKAARTVLGALPRNFNPSDTATKLQYLELANPKTWASSMTRRAMLHRKSPNAEAIRESLGGSASGGTVRAIQRLSESPGTQRFVEPLVRAAQKGDNAFGVTYYLLHQSYPEFRNALEREGSGQ